MTQYTLTYFDIRGRAEPVRLLFAYAGVAFTDRSVGGEDWPRMKTETPLGQLPFLTEHRPEGDRDIPQTQAVLRYLARKHGLDGKTDDERLAADIASETAVDARAQMTQLRFSPAWADDAAKAKYLAETVPMHFARFDKLLGDRNWFAGGSPTFADLLIFDTLERHLAAWPDALAAWPRLGAFQKRVEALPQLQSYLKTRRAA